MKRKGSMAVVVSTTAILWLSATLLEATESEPGSGESAHHGLGVTVMDVIQGSQASEAGILPGDAIINYAGIKINNVKTLQDAISFCAGLTGDIMVIVLREGKTLSLAVPPGPLGVLLQKGNEDSQPARANQIGKALKYPFGKIGLYLSKSIVTFAWILVCLGCVSHFRTKRRWQYVFQVAGAVLILLGVLLDWCVFDPFLGVLAPEHPVGLVIVSVAAYYLTTVPGSLCFAVGYVCTALCTDRSGPGSIQRREPCEKGQM